MRVWKKIFEFISKDQQLLPFLWSALVAPKAWWESQLEPGSHDQGPGPCHSSWLCWVYEQWSGQCILETETELCSESGDQSSHQHWLLPHPAVRSCYWKIKQNWMIIIKIFIRCTHFLRRALARQMSCFSPTEKLSPSASTAMFRPSGSLVTLSFRFDSSKASQTCESLDCPKGSILYLTVPWNRTGSWGMTAIADLKSLSPMSLEWKTIKNVCKYK